MLQRIILNKTTRYLQKPLLFASFKRCLYSSNEQDVHNLKPVSMFSRENHDRLFMQELLKKITEKSNNLPPPRFTKKCCDYYKTLDNDGKIEFFDILSTEFDVDRTNALKKATQYTQQSNTLMKHQDLEKTLQYYLEPRYNLFFDRIHQLPNGLKFLADMRSDLLNIMGVRESEMWNRFTSLEQDIRFKIKKYVIGFLKFKRVTWQNSSAELLEKICQYEAVHAVKDWKDIKRRLGPDRRVYAFFENKMANEPLVFVHVALVPELSSSVQTILNQPPKHQDNPRYEHTADFKCAVCYSITTQRGLGGINLGNYLIKQVVEELSYQYPQIHTFATLSPIPGFRPWLESRLEDISIRTELDSVTDWKVKLNRFHIQDQKELEKPLMALCARYILSEKGYGGKNALDPVANFHLRNGACVHKINWKADTSEKGLNDSFGIMINYNYIPHKLESNHRQYIKNGSISISHNSLFRTNNNE